MRTTVCLFTASLWVLRFASGEEIAIPAYSLSGSSDHRAPVYAQSGGLTRCSRPDGFLAWTVELGGGPSYLHILYASGEPRPCRLSINGREHAGRILRDATGGSSGENLRWASYGPVAFEMGNNVIQIEALGHSTPHLKGLYLSRRETPPGEAVFQGNRAGKASLRRELNRCLERTTVEKEALSRVSRQLEQLRREALLTHNPLIRFDKLLFVKRYTYQSSHYYTDFIDGCKYFGGNLCVLSLADGTVTELAPGLREGIFGRFGPFQRSSREEHLLSGLERGFHGSSAHADLRKLQAWRDAVVYRLSRTDAVGPGEQARPGPKRAAMQARAAARGGSPPTSLLSDGRSADSGQALCSLPWWQEIRR